MRVWDAELLMAKKELNPVADGLILWVDGQDAPQNKYVFDRVSETNMEPTYQTVVNWLVNQDDSGLFILCSGGLQNCGWKNPTRTYSDAQTVELVVSPSSTSVRAFMILNSEYFGRFSTYDNRVNVYYANSAGMEIQTQTHPVHVVMQAGCVYIDGAKTTLSAQYNSVAFDDRLCMIRAYGSYVTGLIGAMRAYNRVLSEAEILQNLEYEKSIGRVVL